MRHVTALVFTAALAATPVMAESEKGEMAEGLDLLSEGTQLLLRGLLSEMEPAIRELEESIENLNAYYPPEVLPNGDIIIRRRVPLVPEEAEETETEI